MVSFAEPRFLWLTMVPAVAVVAALYRHRQRLMQQRMLASPAVWDRLMGGTPATGVLRLGAWCVAALMVALALARPQWGELPAEESVRTRDLVVAVDVSDSMLCPDLRPSRLGRSLDLIHRVLPALEGNRLGVVVFAGDAYPLVPLTTDLQAVASFLDAVTPRMVALPGSNLERAVTASLELLPAEGEGRVVVLITDGENLQGDMNRAATALTEAGAGVLAVVAGTEEGGPIPEPSEDGSIHYKRDANQQPVVTRAHREVLAALADELAGEVIVLADPDSPRAFIAAVDAIRTREVEATRQVRLVERFPLFLGAAALFLIAGFGLSPWRRRALAAVVTAVLAAIPAVAQQAPAGAPQGVGPAAVAPAPGADAAQTVAAEDAPAPPWWQRFIPGGSRRLARRGVAAWHAGDLETAARSFVEAAELEPDNPERLFDLGTALAAGGQLQPAVGVLDQAHRMGASDAAYNAGTAALSGGQADAAVQYLREALLKSPGDAEVKRNYELALQLLQQQEQQQQNQQDQQENQDDQSEQEQQQNPDGEPTPTPSPRGGENQPQPTPTPDLSNQIFAALERAEEEARENMRTPTPHAVSVEKDW